MNVAIITARALGNLARSHIKRGEFQMSCQHDRLELRGLSDNTLWLRDEYLECLNCGVRLLYIPDDVTKIVNIPHPPPAECCHEHKHYHLCGFGKWTCLNCGEVGISSPTAKLHVVPAEMRIGINVSNPQADLHVIGTVRRIEEATYHYGDILDDDHCSMLAILLLRLEGQRVEVTVRVL